MKSRLDNILTICNCHKTPILYRYSAMCTSLASLGSPQGSSTGGLAHACCLSLLRVWLDSVGVGNVANTGGFLEISVSLSWQSDTPSALQQCMTVIELCRLRLQWAAYALDWNTFNLGLFSADVMRQSMLVILLHHDAEES